MPDLESVTESDAASTVEDYFYEAQYEDPEAGWAQYDPEAQYEDPDEQAQWGAQFDAVPGAQGAPESDPLTVSLCR